MTQGVSGWRNDDRWARAAGDDDPPQPSAAGAIGARGASRPREVQDSRDVPQLPEVPLPRGFTEVAGSRRLETAPRVDARDAETRRRLDSFMAAMSEPYRMPDGTTVPVTPAFRMSAPYRAQVASLSSPAIVAELASAASRAHVSPEALGRIESGRGTPREIHSLTQALIDGHPLPRDGVWSGAAVRQLMFDHGIGIDCAGYVQQAFLHASGITRAQAGFDSPINESLSGLERRGFAKVNDMSAVRPGDLVVLAAPPGQPGHRAIVYDQHPATANDMSYLLQGDAPARDFSVGGQVRVFEVDTSWGCNGQARLGGVRRETWWLNESTNKWGYIERSLDKKTGAELELFRAVDGPYDHRLEGFFHRKGV